MELEPGQLVFVKEVHGNGWRTGTIDQPASEPDSYWIRFPDNSILRTRSMLKPRPLPSHFELQAEAQPWNSEGKFSVHSSDSLNLMNVESMLPVTPMGGVTPPATKDRDSKVRIPINPIISTEAPQPSEWNFTECSSNTKAFHLFHQSDLLHLRNDSHGKQWNILCVQDMQCLLGLLRFSVLSNVWTGEAMELCGIFLTFSVFQILLLVTLNSVWQIKSFNFKQGRMIPYALIK